MSPAAQELLDQAISTVGPVLVTLLSAGVAWLGKSLNSYINAKVSNEKYRDALLRLNEVVSTVVLEIQQTEADAMKQVTSPDSPGGRKITKAEAKYLLDKARNNVKAYLGAKAVRDVRHVLGFPRGDSFEFDSFITSRIEANVQQVKRGEDPRLQVIIPQPTGSTIRGMPTVLPPTLPPPTRAAINKETAR